MIREVLVINLVTTLLFVCNCSSVSAQHNPASIKCEPIGRILNAGDRNKKKGSRLCPKDNLKPRKGQKVKVLCYVNRKVLELGEGAVDDSPDKCVESSVQELRQCTPQNRSKCPSTRVERTSKEPKIISPYGKFVLDPRLSISWRSIPEATSYMVSLKGRGVSWSKRTSNTTLLYQGEPQMFPKNVYNLTVIANQGNSSISASSTILTLLSDRDTRQVEAIARQIQSFNLTPDEEARDLDTLFASYDLLTESIQILNQRIDAGSNSPNLYRLLGDRYLEAGFPEKAEPLYAQANKLAQKANNKIEQNLAKKGLERATFLKNYSKTSP